ncbi:hypothetical protein J26TS2_28210 [Shouchella clausii]|nr:hypothetical protein J26TS2_28210 [Shouchella clausii]
MPEMDEHAREEEARRSEEVLRFAEDLIYYAAIIGGIATAMDLVGLTIAREEARKAEAALRRKPIQRFRNSRQSVLLSRGIMGETGKAQETLLVCKEKWKTWSAK